VGGRVWSPTAAGMRFEAGGEAVDLANATLRGLAREVGADLRRSEVGWGDHGPAPVVWHVAGRRSERAEGGYTRLRAELARVAGASTAVMLPDPVGSYGVAVKSLFVLAGDLPAEAPAAAITDSVIGYAYRRGQRTLGRFVGSTPAAWLLGRPRRLADRAAAEA